MTWPSVKLLSLLHLLLLLMLHVLSLLHLLLMLHALLLHALLLHVLLPLMLLKTLLLLEPRLHVLHALLPTQVGCHLVRTWPCTSASACRHNPCGVRSEWCDERCNLCMHMCLAPNAGDMQSMQPRTQPIMHAHVL